MGASQFVTKQFQVGLVGYVYDQLSGDSGPGARLGPFESRVLGLGPQLGLIVPLGETQAYLNLKGYKEFDARTDPMAGTSGSPWCFRRRRPRRLLPRWRNRLYLEGGARHSSSSALGRPKRRAEERRRMPIAQYGFIGRRRDRLGIDAFRVRVLSAQAIKVGKIDQRTRESRIEFDRAVKGFDRGFMRPRPTRNRPSAFCASAKAELASALPVKSATARSKASSAAIYSPPGSSSRHSRPGDNR